METYVKEWKQKDIRKSDTEAPEKKKKKWESKPCIGNLWHKYNCVLWHSVLKLTFKI